MVSAITGYERNNVGSMGIHEKGPGRRLTGFLSSLRDPNVDLPRQLKKRPESIVLIIRLQR